MVQGLGGPFLEHLVYGANGQLLAGNLADHLIPTATEFPEIRAIALKNHRSPSNPLGFKGTGEGAIIPIGGLMDQRRRQRFGFVWLGRRRTSCRSRPPASGTWVRLRVRNDHRPAAAGSRARSSGRFRNTKPAFGASPPQRVRL